MTCAVSAATSSGSSSRVPSAGTSKTACCSTETRPSSSTDAAGALELRGRRRPPAGVLALAALRLPVLHAPQENGAVTRRLESADHALEGRGDDRCPWPRSRWQPTTSARPGLGLDLDHPRILTLRRSNLVQLGKQTGPDPGRPA